MTTQAMERSAAQRTAHAVRTALIRLARERAEREADPSLAYGCVDWFRYDTSADQHAVGGDADVAPSATSRAPASE